ncbi:GtrA family protein [Agilicoccus flavus]|uniref:GtrA family protein n=1 Tax=Agilicoccus flavus TaxID=2775968 RepID=UPI001CF71756|nr:GtrA family protein [Agilicoccus flavus]
MSTSLRDRLRGWWGMFLAEAAKFGVVGGIGVFVDMGAYAFFRYGWFGPEHGPLYTHAKLASVAATAVATLFSWVCNRYWTFRDKRSDDLVREGLLFAAFNVVGALITVACVALAIDVLHADALTWESVARGVGIGLGTLFRFWAYRRFVFVHELQDLTPQPAERSVPARRG